MSTSAQWRVVLVGERADLAARPFETEWGRIRIAAPDDSGGDNADLAIVLDPDVDGAAFASARQVVWHPAARDADTAATMVSRPWPVAEDLFDMPPSAGDNGCLVIAPEADGEGIGKRLSERGLQVQVAAGATRELLAEARIVVSLTQGPPPETFGVLAAGRLLVVQAAGRAYGLQPWVDHMTFSTENDIVEVAEALVAHPAAWTQIQALGRQSAEPHRASSAVGRLIRRIEAGIA